MVFQYDYFNETRALGKDQIGWLTLRTASPALNDRVARTIDQMFANAPYETATDTEKAFSKAFVAQFGNIALIVELVVGAAFVTILMIVGNTLMMSVRERTREMSRLDSPAAASCAWLLGESILVALTGGLAGLSFRAHAAFASVPENDFSRRTGEKMVARSALGERLKKRVSAMMRSFPGEDSGAGADHRARAWDLALQQQRDEAVTVRVGCQRSSLAHRFRSTLGQPPR